MLVLPAAHFVAWLTASALTAGLLGVLLTLACLRCSAHRVNREWERMATDRVLPGDP
ncbi:MAG: hypothetical protein ACRDZO_20325 [Egibacteraceae bacterium]